MTQEDKDLLFKDLCARLPYGVKVTWDGKHPLTVTPHIYCAITSEDNINNLPKLLLRPMSSMTEEEKEEFHKLKQFSVTVVMPNGVSLLKPTYIVDLEEDGDGLNHLYDWLNAHHFDYRGLIEKGLVIEALEGMYNINEK